MSLISSSFFLYFFVMKQWKSLKKKWNKDKKIQCKLKKNTTRFQHKIAFWVGKEHLQVNLLEILCLCPWGLLTYIWWTSKSPHVHETTWSSTTLWNCWPHVGNTYSEMEWCWGGESILYVYELVSSFQHLLWSGKRNTKEVQIVCSILGKKKEK